MLLLSGIIMILAGIFSLLFSIYGKKGYIEKKKRCIFKTEGVIIRFEIRSYLNNHGGAGNSHDTIYYPIYEYFVNGNRYEVMGRTEGKGVYYKETKEKKLDVLIGQKKQIYYNPNNCVESYVEDENLNIGYDTAKILGIILLVLGIIELLIFILFKALI